MAGRRALGVLQHVADELLGALWHDIWLRLAFRGRPHVEHGADAQLGEPFEVVALQMIELGRPVQLSGADAPPGCRGISPDVAEIRERGMSIRCPGLNAGSVAVIGLFSCGWGDGRERAEERRAWLAAGSHLSVSPPASVRVATAGSSPRRCSLFCSSASEARSVACVTLTRSSRQAAGLPRQPKTSESQIA